MTAENHQDNQPQNEEERILGLQEKFNRLHKAWNKETMMTSSMHKIIENQNYQEIIKMGEVVLPFIFKSLQAEPDHWFHALREITGDNPINPEDAGRLHKMTESWLNWAKEKGYLGDSSKE